MNWSSLNGDTTLSYTRFAHFRETVARLAGINLSGMAGWGGQDDWSKIADPAAVLLPAEESAGGFDAGQCRALADRLRELMAAHPESREPLEWFAREFDAAARDGWGVTWG